MYLIAKFYNTFLYEIFKIHCDRNYKNKYFINLISYIDNRKLYFGNIHILAHLTMTTAVLHVQLGNYVCRDEHARSFDSILRKNNWLIISVVELT